MQRQTGGRFDAIGFVVLHLGEVLVAVLHYNVARGTGAASAAGMLQMNSVVERNIEQGSLQTVIRIRGRGRIVIDRDVFGQERNLGHRPYSSGCSGIPAKRG